MRCRGARLLARMRGLGNVVVLTGDEHQNFAGLLNDGDRPVGGRVRRHLDLQRRRRPGPAPGQRPHPRQQSRAQVHQRPARLSDLRRHPRRMADQLHGGRPGHDAGRRPFASGRPSVVARGYAGSGDRVRKRRLVRASISRIWRSARRPISAATRSRARRCSSSRGNMIRSPSTSPTRPRRRPISGGWRRAAGILAR